MITDKHPNFDPKNETEQMGELPRYQCHKKVWALKIKSIELRSDGTSIIVPEDDRYARFSVENSYIMKHGPITGGYYVVYEDGYKSFSPAPAFEEGYTRIDVQE